MRLCCKCLQRLGMSPRLWVICLHKELCFCYNHCSDFLEINRNWLEKKKLQNPKQEAEIESFGSFYVILTKRLVCKSFTYGSTTGSNAAIFWSSVRNLPSRVLLLAHPNILTMYLYSLGTETPKLQSPILAFKTYQLLYCLLFFVWEGQNTDRKCLNLIKEARTKLESKSRKTNHDKLTCELIFLNDDYASVTNFSTTPATEQLSHQRRCTHKYVHYCP